MTTNGYAQYGRLQLSYDVEFTNFMLKKTSVADSDTESGIRDPVLFWPLDPRSGMGKKIKIRIRYEHPGSYFRELRNNFLC